MTTVNTATTTTYPLLRQHSLWSGEDIGQYDNTLYWRCDKDTLKNFIKNQIITNVHARRKKDKQDVFRQNNDDTLQYHFMPKSFGYPPQTRLMTQPCMQTNAIDIVRYCLLKQEALSINPDEIIDILKTLLRLYPGLRTDEHKITRYICLHMLTHKNIFRSGQPPKKDKMSYEYLLKTPEMIKQYIKPLQGLGRNFENPHTMPTTHRMHLKKIANLSPLAENITQELEQLQQTLYSMDLQQVDLFHIAAHAYKSICIIRPLATNNTQAAMAVVNDILHRKNARSIYLCINADNLSTETYCHLMQTASLQPLTIYLQKQYILQHPDCMTSHALIQKNPYLSSQLLCESLEKQKDTEIILQSILESGTAPIVLNTPTNRGWTPLHYACKYSEKTRIAQLIQHGADPNLTNNEQKTAFDLINDSVSKQQLEEMVVFPLPGSPFDAYMPS